MKYIWDIEADNLLDEVTQVWCHVFRDVDTDEVQQRHLLVIMLVTMTCV
jgi:hypothetical protein